ncbi:hypothetical protein WICANDRAFT_81621 [Wickerhamomyces anomalus NRRL Y-366-8]|uniref:U4/U6 snRNA-associated-splicing factor PRP24 n=1 Tax=Wickerhamomyces anomalus (strain ATCC 58044 / CBS 1984 / NCYC 433 / NRRL Y-366-8) TaxID=683960 RepID=A0A1E3NUB5_WICAA|nr:uncharacterized protein WICANDRAFT_81621 [Wickerhamomyces anomalus NRRL Y-366-8]ODQ56791.1 hypothetical protein WICANDRAFT_81621 [Wickerhamomyces anomalus NRRL Y-366-8]
MASASDVDQVKVFEKIELLAGECGPRQFNKEKHIELIQLLRSVKDDMSTELQRAREQYQLLFALTSTDLMEWFNDLMDLEDDFEKWDSLKRFFELNVDDNKTSWFYSMYLQFITQAYTTPTKDENGNQLYTLDMVNLIFDEALQNTKYDFQNSHLVWNKFYNFYQDLNLMGFNIMKNHFLEILRIPHKNLDETFSSYSSFITKYANDHYQQEMKQATQIHSQTQKLQWDIESWELKKTSYSEPHQYWIDYMNFLASKPKKHRKIEQVNAVFERAIGESQDALFISVWLRYTHILYDFQVSDDIIHTTTKRFIKHFPSSCFPYAEFFKNVSNLPELKESIDQYYEIMVRVDALHLMESIEYDEWKVLASSVLICEYNFIKKGDDGITQSLLVDLDVFFDRAVDGCKDVYHSVERLCVLIQESLDQIEAARNYLRRITDKFGSEAENWLISHNFEKKHGTYETASKVLYAAVTRSETLDWPERIFEEALIYEQVYGTIKSYRQLQARIDKKSSDISALRQQALEDQSSEVVEDVIKVEEPEKRKAEEDLEENVTDDHKKRKTEIHRDREHLTVSIKGLPLDTTEQQIIKFFKDCGEVKSHHLVETDNQLHAKVEFADEQSVLRALTKDHKRFHGSQIRVQKAFQTTVWVTNYPPSYTSESIKSLFSTIGQVASVRLPSLKFNTQRRFCYVEFLESKDAIKSVEELNKKDLEGYEIVVKISDPESKTSRTGAVEEKREVYVRKLDFFKVTSEKVKQLFLKYGTVERVNLPLSKINEQQGKKHDGYGFVTFSTSEEAQAALELNLVTLEGRVIEVSISQKKSERVQRKENNAFKDYQSADNVIALLNVPDTINSSRIKDICSEAGHVENVLLEPEHNGAIVEFKDASDAGKASLRLDGKTIGDYTFQVGSVKDLRNGNIKESSAKSTLPMVPSSLRRKQAFSKSNIVKAKTSPDSSGNGEEKKITGRSNDDFRALLFGKK